MSDASKKSFYDLVTKELQAILTLVYLLAVGIGMLFNSFKYAQFGINIFDYADVFDFLIAPFSDIKVLLFAMASVVLAYLFFSLDLLWRKKFPESYSKQSLGMDKKPWYSLLKNALFFALFVFYQFLSADIYSRFSTSRVLNGALLELRFHDNEVLRGKMIGKTSDVLFMLQDETVRIIPYSSLVKEIKKLEVASNADDE